MVNVKQAFSNEIVLYILAGIFLAWSQINFKPEVASALRGLLFVSFMIIMLDYHFLDRKLSIPFKSSLSWKTVIIIGTVYAFVFILVGSFLTRLSLQATLKLFQATMPSFTKAVILTIITWVFAIPFIESITAVRFHELLSNRLKVNVFDLKHPVVLIIIGLIGVSALLFHSTAYGITNSKALSLSFLFFSSGIVLSIKYKEARPFVIGHTVVNGLAFATP